MVNYKKKIKESQGWDNILILLDCWLSLQFQSLLLFNKWSMTSSIKTNLYFIDKNFKYKRKSIIIHQGSLIHHWFIQKLLKIKTK